MKIYFTASIAARDRYLENYHKIVDLLNQNGNDVVADHILNHSTSQIRLETREERLNFQRQLEHWVNCSDCMVVEASFPSISVGYEISLAINRGKPVLILFSEGDPPALLNGLDDEKIVCEHYTLDSLKETITGFLDYVKGKADTRFTFYITASQMAHLTKQAKNNRLPKAAYLRHLIDRDTL